MAKRFRSDVVMVSEHNGKGSVLFYADCLLQSKAGAKIYKISEQDLLLLPSHGIPLLATR